VSREALMVQTLVELADTLVDDFDVVELLTLLTDRCVELLGVTAAGVMLVAPEGDLRAVASSNEAMRVVELLELQAQQGPCPDCFRTGQPVVNHDITAGGHEWPTFAPVAIEAGFRSVHALPLRLRGEVIGALNLFSADAGALSESDVVAGRALADLATIAIVQHRVALEAQVLNEQLNYALTSRVVIEQAKGVVAEQAGLDMGQSFSRIRNYARSHNFRLADVAQSLVEGSLRAEMLAPTSPKDP